MFSLWNLMVPFDGLVANALAFAARLCVLDASILSTLLKPGKGNPLSKPHVKEI